MREGVMRGQPQFVVPVWKESLASVVKSDSVDMLSEQDKIDLAYLRKLRSMTTAELKARIAERQAALEGADHPRYTLPSTIRILSAEEAVLRPPNLSSDANPNGVEGSGKGIVLPRNCTPLIAVQPVMAQPDAKPAPAGVIYTPPSVKLRGDGSTDVGDDLRALIDECRR